MDHWDNRCPPALFKMPKKLCKCGHFNATGGAETVLDRVNYTPCEISFGCESCGEEINYWAYGNYQTDGYV